MDSKQLDHNFKIAQKKIHPDKYAIKSSAEREASASCSSTVNQAYQVLSSPVERAAYLLSLKGITVLQEGGSMMDENNINNTDSTLTEHTNKLMVRVQSCC